MTDAVVEPESVDRFYTVDGLPVQVNLLGPRVGRSVVLLGQLPWNAGSYPEIQERLRLARIQSIQITASRPLSTKAVIGLLDALAVRSAVVVGDRAGAEMAWHTAAHNPQRVTGLVVIDRGHPRTADTIGVVRDGSCPLVLADTTALVSTASQHSVARASRRHVRGDYRITDLAGRRGSRHFASQLSTEIVLRSLTT